MTTLVELALNVTVKFKLVVPALPSLTVAFAIEMVLEITSLKAIIEPLLRSVPDEVISKITLPDGPAIGISL